MSELEELIHGKGYSDKMESFRKKINALSDKYPDVLHKGDTFMKYVIMTTDVLPGRITFGIRNEDGKIPKHIKKEMNEIFSDHFPK